jgi:transcriptional regulator with GAF, ATPase, and Fis domain
MIKTEESIDSIDQNNLEGWNMVRTDPSTTLLMAEDSLARSKELDYEKGVAYALGNMGAANTWLSDYEKALEYCFASVEMLQKLGEKSQEAHIQYYLSIVFYFLSDPDKQVIHAQKAYNISAELGDVDGQANALNGIGTAQYTNNKNEEAIETLTKALGLAKSGNDNKLLARINDGLGNSHINLGQYDEALKFMNTSLKILEKNEAKQTLSYSHDAIGVIYTKLANFPKALKHFNISYKLREEMGFKDGMAQTKIHIAESYVLAGDNLSAVQSYKEALQIGTDLDSSELIYKSHEGLSGLYEDMGNLTLFVKHFKSFHTAKQRHYSETEGKKIRAFELKGRLEQIEKEKAELELKNNQLESYFKDVQTLSSIGHEITSTLDIEGIFQIIYERINSLMDAQGIFVGLCNYKEDKLQVKLAIDNGKRDNYFEYSLKSRKLTNYAVNTGKSVHINDYDSEIKSYFEEEEEVLHNTPQSVVVLPLEVKEQIIGVLYAQSLKKNSFSKHHFNILKSFASYIAIALDNAALYTNMEEKVQERTEELQTTHDNTQLLNKIGQELIATLDFEDVFEKLYANVNKLMDAAAFGIRIFNENENKIDYPYEYEKGKRLAVMEDTMENDNNYSVVCIKKNEPIFINDNLKEYKKWVDEIMVMDVDDSTMSHSLIFYPLRSSKGEVMGVLSIQSFEHNAYSAYDLTIVESLAQYTAIALENSTSFEMMEATVAKRTKEITKTYEDSKLLSEIGRSITSQLNVESIINVAYKNINELMDAEGFGIGIFEKEKNCLSFPGYIESGEHLEGAQYDLKDTNRLASVCFNKQMEMKIDDLEKDYKKFINVYVKPQVGRSVTSIIYLPLVAKDKKIGVITVQSFKKAAFTDYHISMLQSIAVYTGIALDNAKLYSGMEDIVRERTSEVVEQKEEIEQSYQNTKLVSQINKDISSSITIEGIIDAVYENVNSLMDATGFGIGIHRPAENKIVMPGYIENGKKLPNFEYNIDDQRLATFCFNNEKEVFISDYTIEYEKYIAGIQAPVSGKDSTSIIYIPLFSKNKIVGVLTVQCFTKNAYNEYHMDILRGLAATIGAAIENATLYENLEEKVKERTLEVVAQKEQIEKASENTKILSEVGKEIASELHLKNVVSKVYDNINSMMDASIFGIAVFREEKSDLLFSGAIEKGEKLKDFCYELDDERIATRCFHNSEEIIINDWQKEFSKYVSTDYEASEGGMPESMIYLPLVSKGAKIGVLTVQSFEKNTYTEYHINILRTLSIYIANAIDNANLYKGMEDRVKERTAEIAKAYEDTKLLSQMSKTIVESLELESIIKSVYESLNGLLDATCFGIGIHEEEANCIYLPGFIENGKELPDLRFDLGNPDLLASVCFNQNKEIFITDIYTQYKEYIGDIGKPSKGEVTSSIIYLPLNTTNKVVGVMTVQSFEKEAYSDYHLSILRSLATTVATAIDNAMLYESMEDKVNERTAELVEQKEIIEEKNKHITDSIIYAKRIQDATLPSIGKVRSYLDDSFVFFKPKDIVSGDFYWVEEVGDTILFAVVDCTGHGVPGAFLSLIGHNSLNQIVNELGITKPSKILYELDKIVYKTLQNNLEHTNIKDGMDMAICALNKKTKMLEFSGAYNPLYMIRNNVMMEIKGDKIAIGSGQTERQYKNEEIQMQSEDRIYLFSDGYADQFGGERGKKFKYSRFKDLLVTHHKQPMMRQHDILDMCIDEWQGDLEQLDDICVIGVAIP